MAAFKGTITCPSCKAQEEITLHENVCMSTYHCKKCNNTAKATKGCCVFCDYGNVKCPVAPHEE